MTCDVGGVRRPDAVTIDALARLGLTARRHGTRLQLRGACDDLLELLAFVGLGDLFPSPSDVEAVGQPEEREQVRGVEEEGDPGDPTA